MNYDLKHSRKKITDKQGKICMTLLAILLIALFTEMVVVSFVKKTSKEKINAVVSSVEQSVDDVIHSQHIVPREINNPHKKQKPKKVSSRNTIKENTEPTEETTVETEPETYTNGEFLLSINNPDPSYQGTSVYLSPSERTELSHLIMGEAGGEGFVGCCLLAQCVRDAMTYKGYSTISDVIAGMTYNGYKYDTNDDVERAIEYIFDEGNSAVQHRILVMYASDLCEGEWHETQNFIYQHNAVRFFDMWDI